MLALPVGDRLSEILFRKRSVWSKQRHDVGTTSTPTSWTLGSVRIDRTFDIDIFCDTHHT